MSKVVAKPITLKLNESLEVRFPKQGKFFTKKSGKDLLVFEEGNDTPIAVYENYELASNAVDLASLPHYVELATGVATGVATDAVIGSAAAGTTAATSTAAVAAGTAATTGLSTMAMVGIGAVGVGGGAVILNNSNGNGSSSVSTDTTAPTTAGFTFTDAGRSATDGLSSNPTITLALASDTATWQYSLDNGTTWTNGIGNTITLADGTYDKQDVQVKQFDAAGNSSISHMSTTATLATSLMVQLDGIGVTTGGADSPQTTAVGTSGAYVTVFSGANSSMYGDNSVFVQKFNADGTTTNNVMVELQAIDITGNVVMGLGDYGPQVAAVGTSGEYVVTFNGYTDNNAYRFVYVQKFNADGTTTNNTMIKLEVAGVVNDYNTDSQITVVGADGSFVVTFLGRDAAGNDYSIFVQKFNADGTTTNNTMVQLEAIGNFAGADYAPQITAVGTTGEYVVTFFGQDGVMDGTDYSIFVQKFNADGTIIGNAPVRLEAISNTTGYDSSAQVTALGTTGEYVVTFEGRDAVADGGDNSIYVQKFDATGAVAGAMVRLEAIGNTTGYDYSAQVTALGTTGQFVVTFEGRDANNNDSVFVQKFNNDGTTSGTMVELLVPGVTWIGNYEPQITAIGAAGEFVVTFYGNNTTDGSSIFVQKFDANGAAIGDMAQLDVANAMYDDNWSPQITAVGTAGEFIVSFTGTDSTGNSSVFVQKFRADGSYTPDMSNAMMIETVAPTATITVATTTLQTGTTSLVTFAFSEAVVLGMADVSVAHGSLGYLGSADGGITWTATYIPEGNVESIDNVISLLTTYTDLAGNAGTTAQSNTYVIDTKAPTIIAPSGFAFTDTGVTTDGVTSNGMITLTLGSGMATWQYSLDNGATWTAGAGTTFTLPSGSTEIQNIVVKQVDAVGNVSISPMSTMIALEAIGVTNNGDYNAQITAVGTAGEYVVTFHGYDGTDWSVFVQKFDANGVAAGAMVKLEAIGVTNSDDSDPQITAVGTAGEYVVTFTGYDGVNDSIFVQKFNANGTVLGSLVKLEAIGVTTSWDVNPQITAVGTAGEYVVTFRGYDGTDGSIFVQKFNANGAVVGAMVMLESTGITTADDYNAQITAVGTTGEYVVTFQGMDTGNNQSVFVQKFNADGTTTGNTIVQLDVSTTLGNEYDPQITAVGTAGEYVVTFVGFDGTDESIFVQKFNANGTVLGSLVMLEPFGVNANDSRPQITAVGTTGEYVVTFVGYDGGDESIFVQKFDASGAVVGAMVQLEAIGVDYVHEFIPQITAVGTAGEYVVAFQGYEAGWSDYSIFVQKFDVNGAVIGAMVKLESIGVTTAYEQNLQITAVGTTGEYVVTFGGRDAAGNDDSIFVQKFNADGTLALGTNYSTIVVDGAAPVFSSLSTANVHDNITTSTVVYDAQTTEGDTGMSYSISGADMSLFALNATTGEVTFVAAPNVTTPTDTGANNVYDFTITATDLAGNTANQAVALSVMPDLTGTTVTSNGVAFTLGVESIQNGKSYYYITSINGAGLTSHDVLDTAFNGGTDTVDTTLTAGVDDARTFVSAGVTYILPTATELLALSTTTPTGWANNGYFQSATQTLPEIHSHVYVASRYSYASGDVTSDYVVLQVLPA